MLFWQQVIGTIQRVLPVNYVQALCDGLYTTEENLRNNNPQGRSLKIQIELFDNGCNVWVSSDFYPLSVSRLGFDYAMYGQGGGLCESEGAWCNTRALSELMSIKNSMHADIYAPAPKR